MDHRDIRVRLPFTRDFRPHVVLISAHLEVRALVGQLASQNVDVELVDGVAELESRAGRGDLEPDVVFLDLEVLDTAGDAIVHFVQRSFPTASVVALTGNLDGERAARLLTAGVASLNKPVSAAALASVALRFSLDRRAAAGIGHFPESPAPGREGAGRLEALLESYATDRGLSGQQRVVFGLYLAGKNDKEIAIRCACSEATIYEHWRRMARKAGGMHKGCVIADFHRFLDET